MSRRVESRRIASRRAAPNRAVSRAPLALAALGLSALCLAAIPGCSLLPGSGNSSSAAESSQEEAGPTLGARVPSDWQDVRHESGLLYSVPADWTVYASTGSGQDTPTPDGGAPSSPGDPDSGSSSGDSATDWGFGVLTTANSEAGRNYCPVPGGESFRARAGISEAREGSPGDVTDSMARAMGDSMETVFSEHGSQVDVGTAEKIGVSGILAFHQVVRGRPAEPRNQCTPPTIRADVMGVSVGTPEEPKTVAMLLMTDEDEPGVIPTDVIDTVIGSLRFDAMV
ncbi:hypothetical protein [Dietzia sp.]|uniref:hypothetical protein n=1 Tax=Dietzia sp. TaxID=1871616 RepID=UPI002FD983C9